MEIKCKRVTKKKRVEICDDDWPLTIKPRLFAPVAREHVAGSLCDEVKRDSLVDLSNANLDQHSARDVYHRSSPDKNAISSGSRPRESAQTVRARKRELAAPVLVPLWQRKVKLERVASVPIPDPTEHVSASTTTHAAPIEHAHAAPNDNVECKGETQPTIVPDSVVHAEAIVVVDDATLPADGDTPVAQVTVPKAKTARAKQKDVSRAKPKAAPAISSHIASECRTSATAASSSKPKTQAKSSPSRVPTLSVTPSSIFEGLTIDLPITSPSHDLTEQVHLSARGAERTPIPKITLRRASDSSNSRPTELYPGRNLSRGSSPHRSVERRRPVMKDPMHDTELSLSRSPREASGDEKKAGEKKGWYSVMKARQNVLKHRQKAEEAKAAAKEREEKLKRDQKRGANHVFAGWYSDKQARSNVISAKKREADEKQIEQRKALLKRECLNRLAKMAKAYTPTTTKSDQQGPVAESPRPPFKPASRAAATPGRRIVSRSRPGIGGAAPNCARRRTSRRQTQKQREGRHIAHTGASRPEAPKEKKIHAQATTQTPPSEQKQSRLRDSMRSRSLPPRAQKAETHASPRPRLAQRPALPAQHSVSEESERVSDRRDRRRAASWGPFKSKGLAHQQRLRTRELLREIRQTSEGEQERRDLMNSGPAYFAELAERFSAHGNTPSGYDTSQSLRPSPYERQQVSHHIPYPETHTSSRQSPEIADERHMTDIERIHAAATKIQKHVRRMQSNRRLAQLWTQMQLADPDISAQFEWPTMGDDSQNFRIPLGQSSRWADVRDARYDGEELPTRNWAARPPSRGGESWQPLGQTSPPAYEQVTPEQFEQFQYICSPRSSHGSNEPPNEYNISVVDAVRRRENFVSVDTHPQEAVEAQASYRSEQVVQEEASESLWSPEVSLVESIDFDTVKESDDASLKDRLMAGLPKPDIVASSSDVDSDEFGELFVQPVIDRPNVSSDEFVDDVQVDSATKRDISKLPMEACRGTEGLRRYTYSDHPLPKSPGALDMEFAESLHVLETAEQGLSMAQDLQHRNLVEQSQRQQMAVNQARQEEERRELYLQTDMQMRVAMEEVETRQRVITESLSNSLAQGVFAAQTDLQMTHQHTMEKISERERAGAELLREERVKIGRLEKDQQEREEMLARREAKIHEQEQRVREAQEQESDAGRRNEQLRRFADQGKVAHRGQMQARHDGRSSSEVSLGSMLPAEKLENQLHEALGPHTHKTVRRLIPSLPSSRQESAPSSARSLISSSDDRSILSSRGDQFARFSHDLARRMANNEIQRAEVEEKMFRIQQKNVDKALSARIQRLHERQRQSKTPKDEKWMDRRVRKVTMLAQEEHKVLEMQRQQVQKKLRMPDLASIISLKGTVLGSMKKETPKELISPRIPDDEETIDMLLLSLTQTLPKVSSFDEARDTKKEVSRLYRKKQKLLSEKLNAERMERELVAAQRLADKALALRIDSEVSKRQVLPDIEPAYETSVDVDDSVGVPKSSHSVSAARTPSLRTSAVEDTMASEIYESNFEVPGESTLDIRTLVCDSEKDAQVGASQSLHESIVEISERSICEDAVSAVSSASRQFPVGASQSLHESIVEISERSICEDAVSAVSSANRQFPVGASQSLHESIVEISERSICEDAVSAVSSASRQFHPVGASQSLHESIVDISERSICEDAVSAVSSASKLATDLSQRGSPTVRLGRHQRDDKQAFSVGDSIGVSDSIAESILEVSGRSIRAQDSPSASSSGKLASARAMSESRGSIFDSGEYTVDKFEDESQVIPESSYEIGESLEQSDRHGDSVSSSRQRAPPRFARSVEDEVCHETLDSVISDGVAAEASLEHSSSSAKSIPKMSAATSDDNAVKIAEDEYSMSFEGSMEEEILDELEEDIENSEHSKSSELAEDEKKELEDRRLQGVSVFRDRVKSPTIHTRVTLSDDISLGDSIELAAMEKITLGDEEELAGKSSPSEKVAVSPSLQQPQSVLAASALLDLDSVLREKEEKEEKVPPKTIPRPPSPPPTPHTEEVTDKVVEDILKMLFDEIWEEIKEDSVVQSKIEIVEVPTVAIDCSLASVDRFVDLVMEFHAIDEDEPITAEKHLLENTDGMDFIVRRQYPFEELTGDQVEDVESWVSLLSDTYDHLVKDLKTIHLEDTTWTRWKTGFGVSPLQKYREASCPPTTMRRLRKKLIEEMRVGDVSEYDGDGGGFPYMSEANLDELLSREIRRDEKSWLDVEKDATAMKNQITARIFDDLCLELAHELLDMCDEEHATENILCRKT